MMENLLEKYWKVFYDTLYEVWYQELASGALLTRWQRIDTVSSVLVAVTTPGSAIAGWALWNDPGWKFIWAVLAGIASVASILHSAMVVPTRIKEQEEIRALFCELRTDLETFWQNLTLGSFDTNQAGTQFGKLRDKYGQCMKRPHPEIAYTVRLRKKVQDQINAVLKERGYIE